MTKYTCILTLINIYKDPVVLCAYFEIENLQFIFHNITIDDELKCFINSIQNNPKPWKEIILHKISGELFDFIVNLKEAS